MKEISICSTSTVDLYFDVKLNDKAEPVPEKDMSWFDTSLENYK